MYPFNLYWVVHSFICSRKIYNCLTFVEVLNPWNYVWILRVPLSHNIYIYIFFAFLVMKTSGILFLAQAFANLHGKRRQGKFIWKTSFYMLQTCKHDTAKLIFQKVLIFSLIIFFYLQIFKLLFAHFCIFATVQYSHREHLKGLCVDQYSLCVDQYSLCIDQYSLCTS